MFEVNPNHYQIVKETLRGKRTADEQAFASLAILQERLERLRKADGHFADVAFSPDIEKLYKQKKRLAVC